MGSTRFKKGDIPWNKGLVGEEYKEYFENGFKGIYKKGNIPYMNGKNHSEKSKQKMREANLGKNLSPNTEFKIGHIPVQKGKTKKDYPNLANSGTRIFTKEHIRKVLTRRIPSSLEELFQKIIDKYNLPYKYVGNGAFTIDHYNPDFININGQKIAIEVYARFYKLRCNKTIEEWKEKRSKVFKKYGWKIIYFDETEVKEDKVLAILGGV